MKFKYTGKSLLELLDEFGTGEGGLYGEWWKDEDFAKENAPAGEYEIDLSSKLTKLTFSEQSKKIKKGHEITHPAILVDAILSHYRDTGKRLCEEYCLRTKSIDCDGDRVSVGNFGQNGLRVGSWWDDDRNGSVGVSSARKLKNLSAGELELSLESAIKIVKKEGYKIIKEI